MGELAYSCTNESLQAIVSGLDLRPEDNVLAIGGSGDQAFAILEYVKSVTVIDKNSTQIKFIKERIKALKEKNYERFFQDKLVGSRENYGGEGEGLMDKGLIFYKSRRDEYFSGARLDIIKEKLEYFLTFPSDVFDIVTTKHDFSKIYLSNILSDFRPDDLEPWIPNLKENLRDISKNLLKEGLVYISVQLPRYEVFKGLRIDKSLTRKARKLDKIFSRNFPDIHLLNRLFIEKLIKSIYITKYLFQNMKLGVLFSGGKDSTFATYTAKKQGNEIACLISVISENKDSYMFHTPSISKTQKQAEVMGIPLLLGKTKGEKEKELVDLEDVIKKAKEKYKIEGIVTGALHSNYQASRIQKICDNLNLKCVNPLWHKNQFEYLNELIKNNFKIIVIGVSAYPLNEKWLGKTIDKEFIEDVRKLNEKYKIHPAGEGGEFETFVLDCPLFKKPLKVIDSKIHGENHYWRMEVEVE